MEHSSLSPFKNHDFSRQNPQIEVLKDNNPANRKIKQGMSPKEISEVVSDHLIGVVKQQFEIAKKEFRERK